VGPTGGVSSAALTPPLQVAAYDSLGNVATGFTAAITLAIGTNPGGASLGGTNPVNAVNGIAVFSDISLDRSGSGYTLTASATGLTGTTSAPFDVTASAAAKLAVTTQPSASASSGAALARQPVVQVRDVNDNAVGVAGITVTASVASGPAGATLAGATAVTDASGAATFSGLAITGTVGSYALRFGAPGLTPDTANAIALTAGAAAQLAVAVQPSTSASSGVPFAQQPAIQIEDGAGNAVARSGDVITAAIASGGGTLGGTLTATTDATGLATFTDLAISGSTGTRTLDFSASGLTSVTSGPVTIGSGTATQIALQAGDGQTAVAGTAVAIAPAVVVTDAVGNPVAGVSVTFTVTGGGGSVGPAATVNTDAAGIASVTWTLGTAAGANGLSAAAAGLTGSPVLFTATGIAGAPAQLTISGGNNLTGPVGTTLATPHEVAVTDAHGNPISGVNVAWAAGAGGGSVTIALDTTDANGHATTYRILGATPGTQTTIATVTIAGAPTSVTFTITATVGGASQMSLYAGDNQTDTVGATLPVLLAVRVADSLNNPVSGVTISWAVTGGGGSVLPASSLSDAQGIATTAWTLGTVTSPSAATQTARATGVGSAVNFIATATPGAVSAAQSGVAVTPASITASTGANTSTVTVTARDGFGNVIPGAAVVLAATGTGNSLVQPSGATNTSGQAAGTFASTLAGAHTLSATVAGTAITQQPTVTVVAAAPAGLTFLQGPSDVVAGAIMTPAVTVAVRDGFGNLASTATDPVTLAFGNNAGSGTLGGTLLVNAAAGIASFANLTVDRAASGYTLTASSGVLSGAVSGVFTVSVGSASPATSTVTVSGASVVSGSAVTVTLHTVDASGNPIGTGGLTNVAFTRSGGTSTGSFGPVIDVGDGTYTATFTGDTAGTATTIGATIGGTPVTTTLPTVTVTPGPVSLSQSQVTVSVPGVTSGGTATITLQSRDAAGNALTTGGLTVAFGTTTGTGVSTGTIGPVSYAGGGAYTAVFTGVSTGTPTTITATIGGQPVTSTLPTIQVSPGLASPATSVVQVSSGTVASGSGVTLTLLSRDAAGNTISTGGETVVFSYTGGTSTGTISPAGAANDPGNGTYNATFTGVLAGTATTIQATLNGSLVTTTMPTVTVTAGPAAAATSTVTADSTAIASGHATIVTLQARDAAGNPVPTGGGAVTFTHTGTGSGTFSTVTDVGNGTYTATFTGSTAGTTTLGATLNSATVGGTAPLTVVPGTVSTTTSVVSADSTTIASGHTSVVTLRAKDAAGNNLTTGGATVVFTVTGTGSGTFAPTADSGNGVYTAVFTGTTAGAVTLGATINASTVVSTAPLTVTLGSISATTSTVTADSTQIASGHATILTLQAKDANGNNLTTGGATVVFTQTAGTGAGTFSAVTDNANGTYTGTFTGTTAGPVTLGATVNTVATTSTVALTVNVGAISATTSTVSADSTQITSGHATILTLQAKDANGNNLTTGGATVVFMQNAGAGSGTFSSTTDNANGTYTATFTGTTAGPVILGATISGVGTNSTANLTVNVGTIAAATSTVSADSTQIASGHATILTLQAKDVNGNNLATGGATVVFTQTAGTGAGTFSAVTDNANGTYTGTFTGTTAGPVTLGATVNTVATTSTAALTVAPGTITATNSTVTADSTQIASGHATILTLQAKDANGNNLTTGGATVVFTKTAGSGAGTFSAVTDNGNGTYTGTFTGTTAGPVTLGATVNSVATTSTAAVTVTVGTISAATSVVTADSAQVAISHATILTLQAKDAAGNLLTTGGATVVFSQRAGNGAGTFSAVTDNANGTYTATFTATKVGQVTVGATVNTVATTSTVVFSVTP